MIEKIKKHWVLTFIMLIIIFMVVRCNTRVVMLDLPIGEHLENLDSPTGEYTLRSYRYSGGATVDWTLRVEVLNNETNKKYNIYWVYHEKDAEMKWLDEETVEINGTKLNIFKDYLFK